MADMDKIRKYKKYLDKYQDRDVDNDELLSVLRKLGRLDVTLEHLQTTGIGKSVNIYRKHGGGIGDKVRALIAKWKDLVPTPVSTLTPSGAIQCETVSETSYDGAVRQECDSTSGQRVPYLAPSRVGVYRDSVDSVESEPSVAPPIDDHSGKISHDICDKDQVCDSSRTSSVPHGDKHRKREGEEHRRSDKHQKDKREKERASNHRDRSHHGHGGKDREKSKHKRDKHSLENSVSHSPSVDKSKISTSPYDDGRKKQKSIDDSIDKASSSSKRDKKHKSDRERSRTREHNHSKDDEHCKSPSVKFNVDDSSMRSEQEPGQSTKTDKSEQDLISRMNEELLHDIEDFGELDAESSAESSKPTMRLPSPERERTSDQDQQVQKFVDVLKNKKRKHDPIGSGVNAKKLKSEPKKEVEEPVGNQGFSFDDLAQLDQMRVKKHMKKKQKTSEIKSVSPAPSNRSSKGADKMKSDSSNQKSDAHSSSSEHEKAKSSSSEKHHKHDKDRKSREHSSKSSSSRDASSKSKSESSKHKSHSSHGDRHSSSSSGKHEASRDKSHSASSKHDRDGKSKHRSSSSHHSNHKTSDKSSRREDGVSASKRSSSHTTVDVPPPPKQMKLSAEDIVGTLPDISPNYRPLPYPKPESGNKHNEAADDAMVSKKNTRTQIYSGRKQVFLAAVPTLFEACMGVLKENIDNIESVGGIPADILTPVLERCNAGQLYNLEEMNPHFIGDTEDCWEKLCRKDFKSATPSEFESWRELYLRLHDEREAKLKKLTANIAVSHAKRNEPVRKTQLAYVDVTAKPPRGVRRQQMKHGTAGPMSKQDPLSRLKSHEKSHSQPRVPFSRPRTEPVSEASRPQQQQQQQKQTKIRTPMMQKTMRMMKNFRR